MGHCSICATELKFPFECVSCGNNFCDEHKYPENHQCPSHKNNNLKNKTTPDKQPKASTTNDNPDLQRKMVNETGQKPEFTIGKYDIYEELGRGGFGIVYRAYSKETHDFIALKTFKDELLKNSEVRSLFWREANVWVDLDRHPYIVRANFVEDIGGRLYIVMEYIGKNGQGLNTLADYLEKQPPDLAQSLRWAIQFCYGMEYAYSKGLRCHRDIKPGNIMITIDKTLKISDFGLAGALSGSRITPEIGTGDKPGEERSFNSLLGGKAVGTPRYMPPEQCKDASSCDQRSDIYSFGVVLYEMVASREMRSCPQFFATSLDRFNVLKINPKISSIIGRCLERNPCNRYQTFQELRKDLEPLLERQTGEKIRTPEIFELQVEELNNKGAALNSLYRYDEAIEYLNKALQINPKHEELWFNKAASLNGLGRFMEALECCNKALKINQQNAFGWNNKGNTLNNLRRFNEAIECFEMALEINPQLAAAMGNKGVGKSC